MPRVRRRDVLRAGVGLGTLAVAGCAAPVGSPAVDPVVNLAAAVARTEYGVLRSAHWPGRNVPWRLAVPAQPRGLVIALHGRGGSARTWFDLLGATRHAAATGLAIAAIDGAEHYWHLRSGNVDTGALVLEDFLPMLAARGLPTERIGLTGISMGGYGALLLATQLPPERVFAVATMGAALWPRRADYWTGAFDGPGDFAAHNVFARRAALRRLRIWLICGDRDRFQPGNRALAARLPLARATFDSGSHTVSYWRRHWGPALRWMSRYS